MFRKGGYRSYGNYISIAVDMHEEAGREMTPALKKASRKKSLKISSHQVAMMK